MGWEHKSVYIINTSQERRDAAALTSALQHLSTTSFGSVDGFVFTVAQSSFLFATEITVRKQYLIPANLALHCVLRYQGTGSLPAHLSLTISSSLSAIHTSGSKVLHCSDDARYSAPTPENSRLRSKVWLCSRLYKWTYSTLEATWCLVV